VEPAETVRRDAPHRLPGGSGSRAPLEDDAGAALGRDERAVQADPLAEDDDRRREREAERLGPDHRLGDDRPAECV
jgi:hypothetical protein